MASGSQSTQDFTRDPCPEPSQDPVSIKAVLAVIACVSVFTVSTGTIYPMLALVLEGQGVSRTFIGLNAAMVPLGFTVAGIMVPRWAPKAGFVRTVLWSGFLLIGIVLALGTFRHLAVWMVLSFLFGVASNALHIVSETWINMLSPQVMRGRIIGFYGTAASLAFCMGPLLLSVVGSDGYAPFMTCAAFITLAMGPVWLVRKSLPESADQNPIGFRYLLEFLPRAPVAIFAYATIAFFSSVNMPLLPLYLLDRGYSEADAALILSAVIFGGVFSHVPAGWAADRFTPRRVMYFSAVATVLLTVAVYSLAGLHILPLPLFGLWGFFAYLLYTLPLKEFGDRFSGRELIVGTGTLGLAWGVTAIVSLPVSGAVSQGAGGAGVLPFLSAGLYFILLLLIPLRALTRRR